MTSISAAAMSRVFGGAFRERRSLQTTKMSVHGAINMLGLAKRLKAKILQASTSEVYGDPIHAPTAGKLLGQRQFDWARVGLRRGQALAETLFFDWLKFKVTRTFNTYGPRMHPNGGRVVSNFIMLALRGKPITSTATNGIRDRFMWTPVEGLVRLMDTPAHVTGPINLGNPVEFTIAELAAEILQQTGSASRIEHQPLPPITLARDVLGWAPTVLVRTGLKSTMA